MEAISAKVRTWGRSLGIVIPKETTLKERIKDGDNVEIFIVKKRNPIKETFGVLKGKIDTKKLMEEIDKEGWDD